ncbi:hypothetical protein AWC11_01640 [Mycobacterium interjectum]|nr:hypothetical protein AWC11_01640 [Mycobacterium interjectum]
MPPTGDNQFPYIVDIPKIGPCAYRGFNQRVCVYLHMYLPSHAEDGGLDTLVRLTATEARQLAADLIAVADEIGDAR